jgi:hypothetical protein
MTAADALVAELRELGLGAEPAGDWVQVTIAGLPLTPLLIIPAPRPDILAPPGTGPVWTWRRGGQRWSHPCGDPHGAAAAIAASFRVPPDALADPAAGTT